MSKLQETVQDRGARRAAVHELQGVRHCLVTEQQVLSERSLSHMFIKCYSIYMKLTDKTNLPQIKKKIRLVVANAILGIVVRRTVSKVCEVM